MVRDSWRMMQVPIIGIIGILMIFILVAVKLGVTTDVFADDAAVTGYVPLDPTITGERCSDLYDPVCGNDGYTYDNFCLAAAAGVQVAYQGACR